LLDPPDHIGCVRVRSVATNSDTEFQDALRSLRGQGARGLVLDLRWCPGGYLNQAAGIAQSLLPEGAAVATQRYPRRGQVLPAQTPPDSTRSTPYLDFQVVVLVGGETTGGGELIAAALQDSGRGVIAGQRTAGKGSIQSNDFQLRYGIPFKLTTGMFIRPSGKNLQRNPDSKPTDDWGVRPDAGRELPLTPESSRQLKEGWLLYELRPADSTEALPLDDPENDPQRHAAVQILRELLKKQS